MKKSVAALVWVILLSSLLFVPFADADSSIFSSDTSDTGVETGNPALIPTELWNFTAANTTAHTTSLDWGSPVVANRIAYVWNTETYIIPDEPYVYLLNIPIQHRLGTIYALNASSGAKLWNFTTHGIVGSLTIIDGVAYVCASDPLFTDGQSAGGNFYALDAVTGAQKWVYNIDGDILWSSINAGVVYVFFHASGFNSYVCAVKAANGEELWKWNAGYYVFLSQPSISNRTIYFGTYGRGNGHYYAINTVNGTVLWRVATDGAVREFSSVVNGIVYFNSDNTSYPVNNTNNYLYALNAQNGDKLWSYPVGFIVRSPPIVDGGIVYVDGREATLKNPYTLSAQLEWGTSNVFALNASNGNKIWNYSANDTDFWSLSLIDDVVYFSSNGTINALNAANGAQLWSYSTYGNGPLTINDGVLYFYSGKTLYAVDTSNGNSLWNYTTNSNQSFLTVANSTAFFDAGNTVYALSVPDAEGTAVGLYVGSIEQVLIILSIITVIVVSSAIVLAKKRKRR